MNGEHKISRGPPEILCSPISPAAWFHINLAGFYDFGEKKVEIDVEKIAGSLSMNLHHKDVHDDVDFNSSAAINRGIEPHERRTSEKKKRVKSEHAPDILEEMPA